LKSRNIKEKKIRSERLSINQLYIRMNAKKHRFDDFRLEIIDEELFGGGGENISAGGNRGYLFK